MAGGLGSFPAGRRLSRKSGLLVGVAASWATSSSEFIYRLELIAMSLKRSSTCAATRTQLIDAVMDGYVTWREESVAVEASYQYWSRAPRDARASAFAAYVAALDREERAASEYGRLIEQTAA
jgi:hypothetical protein